MIEIGAAESATDRCPQCDYDLRGLPEPRCPECGKFFSASDVAAYAERRWPPQRFFRTLILATTPWFIAYPISDAIHETLDRVELNWATFPFLAFSLQLFLALAAASALEASETRFIKRLGAALTIVVWIMILGHIAITAWTL